jgi:hypothetical protein
MPGLRLRASTIRPRAGSGMECRRGPMAVNLLSTIRRQAADDSMVHATLGLRPPATIRRARIPRVAWTVRRRRYRTIVKFRLRMRGWSSFWSPGRPGLRLSVGWQPSASDLTRRQRSSPAPARRAMDQQVLKPHAHGAAGMRWDLGRPDCTPRRSRRGISGAQTRRRSRRDEARREASYLGVQTRAEGARMTRGGRRRISGVQTRAEGARMTRGGRQRRPDRAP